MKQLAAAAGLAWLAGCATTPGEPCTSANQCPANSYCLASRCVSSTTVSQNLSVLVTPIDPRLPPQQFLPRQYRTGDGFSTLTLGPAQPIRGMVSLPSNCIGDAGYPIELDFTAPSPIPGSPSSFRFFSNASGVVDAVLPQGNYAERISTASACAAPILGNDLVSSAEPFVFPVFPAPIVASDADQPDDGGMSPALDVTGTVVVPFANTGQYVPLVRILAPRDAGVPAGTPISGDQPLLHLGDGGWGFGLSFVPGGPPALPVQPPPSGGIVQTFPRITGVEVQTAICQPSTAPADAGFFDGGRATCDNFVVELGPSTSAPELPTIDAPVVAPESSGEPNESVNVLVKIPFNPVATYPISVAAQDPLDAGRPLPLTAVGISTVDGGITACQDPDAGVTCSLTYTAVTDVSGAATFHVVPGRYGITLQPRTPLGAAATMIDVLNDGLIAPAFSGGGSQVIRAPDGGQLLILTAVAPVTLQGTVHEVSAEGPILPAGEARILTRPGMVPVAQQSLNAGAYSLQVPPGQYVLLIEPDAATHFPTYYTDVTAQAGTSPNRLNPVIPAPGKLAGVVAQVVDGGLPVPAPSYLRFFYVATDGNGNSLAIPVAATVTDSQGRWSAAGPPGE